MIPRVLRVTIVVLQVNSEFQAFKHIEVLASGELMRASTPLEATLSIQPTLLLRNALPYSMDVVIWQVGALKTWTCNANSTLCSGPGQMACTQCWT